MSTRFMVPELLLEPTRLGDSAHRWFRYSNDLARSIVQYPELAQYFGRLASSDQEAAAVYMAVQPAFVSIGADRPTDAPGRDGSGLGRALGQGLQQESHVRVPNPQELLSLVELRLAQTIADSEYLLSLETDWDGEESPGYAEQTWHRAVRVLVKLAEQLRDNDLPPFRYSAIMPGPDGDLDLEVRSTDRRLLLSVPVDSDAPIQFFGHDEERKYTIKGMLNGELPNRWLAEWLSE